VHGWSAYSAALALAGSGVPLVVSVRDYGYSCATRSLLIDGRICDGPAWGKCLHHANRNYGAGKGIAAVTGVLALRPWLARRTRVAHVVSRYVATIVNRDLLRAPATADGAGDRIAIIADIVPAADAATDAATAAVPVPAGLPDGPFILFVGALQPHKGLAPLIAAWRRLASPPPLVMVGTRWPDTPTLPDDVTVLSDVPHAQVMATWDRCLFGVVPSVWPDPLPGTVREAMSRGKAVIGSDVGGIPDMVVDGVTGLLVPPGDVGALAAAMQRLLDDASLRDSLGARARADAARYDAATVATWFGDLYESVTPGSGR
jgi:glycosyltransferase involved in cell wall biosynthesis